MHAKATLLSDIEQNAVVIGESIRVNPNLKSNSALFWFSNSRT